MTRRGRTGLVALGVASLLAAGGWLLVHSASATQFAAGALGALIDRRVEVGAVELHAGAALEVELRDLQVFEKAAADPALGVDRVVARLGWPQLLAGNLVPVAWTLVRPVLRLRSSEKGPTPTDLPLRPLELTVRDGTLVWGEAEEAALKLTRVQISARSRPLRGSVRGTAMGQLERSGRTLASFSVEFNGEGDRIEAQGSVSGYELAAFSIPPLPPMQGRASGTVAFEQTPGRRETSVDLDLAGLVIRHPSLREPVAPQKARVVADLRQEKGKVEVRLHPLQLDDFAARGTIEVGGGDGPDARVVADLSADAFRPGLPDDRLQFLRLMGLRFSSWARADERTRGGRIEGLTIRLDVLQSLLADTLAFRRKSRRDEIQIDARIQGGVYEPYPGSAPLEQIESVVHIRGNRLDVYDLRMNRQGRPLPEIDITVDGLHRFFRLPQEERRAPAGPGVPIPGLGPAFAALSRRSPGAQEEKPLILQDLRLGYPAFLLPIRNATAVVRFPDGNVQVENLEGVIGGAPARVQALWDRDHKRVTVHLSYLDGDAPAMEGTPAAGQAAREEVALRGAGGPTGEERVQGVRAQPTPSARRPWIEGIFAFEKAKVGIWPLEKVEGKVTGTGAELRLSQVDARLAGGRLQVDGTVTLDNPNEARVEMRLEHEGADAEALASILGLGSQKLTGDLSANGTFEGSLRPDRPFSESARIDLEVAVADGTVGKGPLTLTLARLASIQGWTGLFGRPLPFKTLGTSLHVDQGTLQIKDFKLTGPELRILAAGQVEILEADRPVNLLVALLLFNPVDWVIGTVPVVGDWILGKDQNLVALYFRLEGPWASPDGSYIPPQTLRTAGGWAERIIVGGVRRLRDLFRPGSERTEPN